jgi:hypothetical protein
MTIKVREQEQMIQYLKNELQRVTFFIFLVKKLKTD